MATNADRIYDHCVGLLHERGVQIEDISKLTLFLQEKYIPNLTLAECTENVDVVLHKREVQNAIMTGIQLDKLAEAKELEPPLQQIVEEDEGLYGVDEIMALSIVNVYGSIGLTNYGYIDKIKPGILAKLNAHEPGIIHTFLDDIVGAIAASAASRLAHAHPETQPDVY
ncbi:phosphatidylglycerophosphatase A [Schleiferilactobacillus harbinensis]|jgi:phosphatidylglycerophosphatase A|uniref:Phosphatidylglycerophosphatase A n=2 Tax=Schleiferilactobacillus harbinensis TaxID=304207 RepID=A0A510TZY8_9LACO|nr:phosphatidylglycerophosphatase A [Schleiferilactobacillus harbinensis]HAY52741.1 phosphatidylglycerophosphatase A [Lactobacillus sp.]KRM27238.1 phosphatidylglycerophosphatase A related protein [Schleiferilactobacillus harbinensis DSM 16991]MBO3091537.1 phosphatidylglycerophosphatase A [Schleiferilactobacillus harbinensis]MCI1687897.1 phosphatidylglycerophosphatase A [Schleiferilactobacillus harbinensis]MCI1782368.1 phosphatidylglycerophosphatase A [Schleiferilactobacillus harbinensis]